MRELQLVGNYFFLDNNECIIYSKYVTVYVVNCKGVNSTLFQINKTRTADSDTDVILATSFPDTYLCRAGTIDNGIIQISTSSLHSKQTRYPIQIIYSNIFEGIYINASYI